jgi:hypothetical protein
MFIRVLMQNRFFWLLGGLALALDAAKPSNMNFGIGRMITHKNAIRFAYFMKL